MIVRHCPRCNKIVSIEDEDNIQDYWAVDANEPCCRLSEPEARLLAAIMREEYNLKECTDG